VWSFAFFLLPAGMRHAACSRSTSSHRACDSSPTRQQVDNMIQIARSVVRSRLAAGAGQRLMPLQRWATPPRGDAGPGLPFGVAPSWRVACGKPSRAWVGAVSDKAHRVAGVGLQGAWQAARATDKRLLNGYQLSIEGVTARC